MPALLARMRAEGNTAIYDAIWLAVEQIRDKGRRTCMVVLTDGEDNSSTHTLQQVLDRLAELPALSLDIIHVGGGGTPSLNLAHLTAAGHGEYVTVTETEIKTTVVERVRRVYV